MDFLLEALEEIAAGVFNTVATLLNLDLDIVFVDSPANRGPACPVCGCSCSTRAGATSSV